MFSHWQLFFFFFSGPITSRMPMKNKYRWPGFLNLWVDWRPPECGWLEIHGWDDALSPTFSQSRLAFSRYLRTIDCQGESNIRFRYAIRYIKEKFITASGGVSFVQRSYYMENSKVTYGTAYYAVMQLKEAHSLFHWVDLHLHLWPTTARHRRNANLYASPNAPCSLTNLH